jgi:trehalose 6-phosphate synthase/phosphatase
MGPLSRSLSHSTVQAPTPILPSISVPDLIPSASTNSPFDHDVSLRYALTKTSSAASIFIPKSRVNSPPAHSVTSLGKRELASGLSGVKRTPYQRSSLKFSTRDEEDSDGNDEIDDGYDTQDFQKVPKYGGFSKTQVLTRGADIFEKSSFQIVEFAKGNGGLKNAINSSLEDGIVRDFTWLGTIGIPTDELSDSTKLKITKKLREEYHSESVLPSDFTFQGHYKNFCKQILWPTLHYQIPDNPNSKAFEDHSWDYYRELNQLFADKIVEIYRNGDIIWIHDYHLLLVPEMIRSKLPNAQIGFFLHVSFPSSEVFRCFAQREALLKGLLGSNSISFQTQEYVRHFLQTCNKLLLADISDNELRYKGHTVKVCAQPVGIDAHKLRQQISSDLVKSWREMIRSRWGPKKLIIGRDKFDRIRGVKQKLLAYESFLQSNPQYIEEAVLIQICLKSSTVESALESEIMSVVDRINSLSPNISNTQPVVFLHQDIDFVQYLALIAEADTFIVSSMREGMNLTCHEFIVATAQKKSPLILSEFTGSAAVLKKGAIVINPWNTRQVCRSYKIALEMTPEEREKNWRALYDVVSHQDCDYWVQSSLEFILDSWQYQQQKEAYFTLDVDRFQKSYKSSKNKLFVFLLSKVPSERNLSILRDLSQQNHVYVLSTSTRLELERIYRRFPHLGLIAEGGGFIRLADSTTWLSFNSTDIETWLETTAVVAESFAERLPGSRVEVRESTLMFHTEQVEDEERKASTVGDLITHVNSVEKNIHATVVENTVFVLQSDAAFKAVRFLIKYLTCTGAIGTDVEAVPPTSPSSSANTASESFKPSALDFLCIGGGANDLYDPVLEYGNEVANSSEVEHVYTISFGGEVSNAKEHVEGLNELFSVIKNLL